MFAELLQKVRKWFAPSAGVTILPPLQQSRRLAEPQRPHFRRVAAVREALASAPDGLSVRELVKHIAARTGKGASPKLILRLRRGGTAAVLVFALASCGCNRTPTQTATTPATTPTDAPVATETPARHTNTPRLIKAKLTITSPDDLRVKVGDTVEAGALLADRRAERERLRAQRQQLVLAARRLGQQITGAQQSLALLEQLGVELPAATFAAETAAVRRAEVSAATAARRAAVQRERLKALPLAVPAGFDHKAVESHEGARLAVAEDGERQASADVELERARLTAAREAREFEAQRFRVDSARQLLSARGQLQQAETARAQLAAQIATLDYQIAQLSAVRAAFAGKVERISWEEQNDEVLTVVVYLAVSADGERAGANH